MNTRYLALAGLLVASPLAAQQQDAAPLALAPAAAPEPLQVAPPVQARAMLQSGTELPLRLLQELTTQDEALRVGDRFRMETIEPVVINGVTVIPAGTPATGEIVAVRNKGMWGKSGKFTARLLYVTVNGRQIRLSGGFDDKGVAGGVAAVAVSAIVFAPAGFFMTGTSARVPSGTVVRGFIDENVPLALPMAPQAAPEPEPLMVGSAGPIAAAAPVPAPQSTFENPSHRRPPSSAGSQ